MKSEQTGLGLTKTEKFNVKLVEAWHSVPALTRLSMWMTRRHIRLQFEIILHNIFETHNFERLAKANYDNGVLICANHRSYIDNFAIAVRGMRYIPKDVRMLAPARTEGIFDAPYGIFVNFFLTFMNTYPPVVRSSRGAMWGKQVIQILTDLLLKGRTAIFIHPEGGRNKGDDPYKLLHAKPGLGKIIHATRATVFPVFLQGFPTTPKGFISANYGKTKSKAPLVHAMMGEPMDFAEERAKPASPEVYREIGRRLMEAIVALSVEERELRARLDSESALPQANQVSEAAGAGA